MPREVAVGGWLEARGGVGRWDQRSEAIKVGSGWLAVSGLGEEECVEQLASVESAAKLGALVAADWRVREKVVALAPQA